MNTETYIDIVRSSLVANHGMNRKEADEAIKDYQLETRIERHPLIINLDDPKMMAEIIVKEMKQYTEV